MQLNENIGQTNNKQLVTDRQCDSKSINSVEPEIVEIIPRTIQGNLIVAREISFQSSFDVAAMLHNSNDSQPIKIDEVKNMNIQDRKEDNIEDEETLNQITPIPTTLELSS